MTDTLEVANGRFARGFSCAQSIFSAFAAQDGLQEDVALQLAAPFGAGMGRAGETCGALSGALLVLGLKYAKARPEYKDQIYAITREFMEQFRRQHGTTLCREIVGYDISQAEELQAAREQNVFERLCPKVVESTARALDKYITEHPAT